MQHLINMWPHLNNNHRTWGPLRRTQSIYSTKLLQMGPTELQGMMVMSITAVFMVLTRFAPSKSWWGATLMVCILSLMLDLSHKTLSVLVNYLHVHVKLMYQLYSILKDCDEPPTLGKIDLTSAKRWLDKKTEAEYLWKLEKSSENIKKVFWDQQACAIVSEITCSLPSFPTNNLTIGAMGPGEVQASTYGMDHCMWPAIWRSGKARVHCNDELCASHWHLVEDSKMQWHQAVPDKDGWWYNWGCTQNVLGTILSFCSSHNTLILE